MGTSVPIHTGPRARASSLKPQASGLTGPWIWDIIGPMQAQSAAQCERSGSGINTMIKPGLQVGPGIPSSLIFIFSLLKSQASSSNLQAPSTKLQAPSRKRQARGPVLPDKVSSTPKPGSRQV